MIAILATINTQIYDPDVGEDGRTSWKYQYAYFPNDIENVGYEYAPNEEGIFGDGMGVLAKRTTKPVIKVTETDETGACVACYNENCSKCAAGHYLYQGHCIVCPEGYFCPEGSMMPTAIE